MQTFRFFPVRLKSVSSEVALNHYTVFALVAITAATIGIAIGRGEWLYALGALAILSVLIYPVEVTFGLFALLIPFDSIVVLGQADRGRTLTWFAGAAAAIILLAVGLVSRRLTSLPPSSILWTAFILWCAVTAIWALSPETSLELFPTTFALLGLYIASACFTYTASELRRVTFLGIAGGCAAAAWTAYLFHQGTLWTEAVPVRASLAVGGRQTNPNLLAMSFLLPISLALGYFLSYRHWLGKAAMLLALAVTTLGLLLTMSRGAIVALVVLFFVYVWRLRAGSRILVPTAALAILLCFMPLAFFTRIQAAGKTGGSGRLDIWTVGLTAFTHYGLVGAGINNFPLAYTNYMGAAPHFKGASRDPHNIYLGIAVETGILGLLLFAGAVRSTLCTTHHSSEHLGPHNLLLASEAACWAMLAFGMFGTILWHKAFWFSWILLTAARRATEAAHLRNPPDTFPPD